MNTEYDMNERIEKHLDNAPLIDDAPIRKRSTDELLTDILLQLHELRNDINLLKQKVNG